MPIPKFFSRTDAFLGRLLTQKLPVVFLFLEGKGHSLFVRDEQGFLEYSDDEIAGDLPVMLVLSVDQYKKDSFRLSDDEADYFDKEVWLEEHRQDIFPPGVHPSGFEIFTTPKTKEKEIDVIRISKVLLNKASRILNNHPFTIHLTESEDLEKDDVMRQIVQIESGGSWLWEENLYKSWYRPILQRATLAVSALIFIGFLLTQVILFGIDSWASHLHEVKNAFSIQKKEHIEFQRIENDLIEKAEQYRNLGVAYNSHADILFNILSSLPKDSWLKDLTISEDKIKCSIYTSSLNSTEELVKNTEATDQVSSVIIDDVSEVSGSAFRKRFPSVGTAYELKLTIRADL